MSFAQIRLHERGSMTDPLDPGRRLRRHRAGQGVLDETAPGFLGLYIGALSEEPVRAPVEGRTW
jgi:hypothetical protein